jgi:hypothetical protein
MSVVLVFGESVEQIQEKPQILPWLLGFLLAMFLLNLGISFFRKKGNNHHQNMGDSTEKKQHKP